MILTTSTEALKRRLHKSLFGEHDLKKGVYADEYWAAKFVGTDMHADALRCAKEAITVRRLRDAIYEKYDMPYDMETQLSAVDRAKRQMKRKADQDRVKLKEKACSAKCEALEDKLLDLKIKDAEIATKMRHGKVAKKGLVTGAAKLVAHESQKFIGEEGREAVAGAQHGAHLAHAGGHGAAPHAAQPKAKAPMKPGMHKAKKSEGYEPMATKGSMKKCGPEMMDLKKQGKKVSKGGFSITGRYTMPNGNSGHVVEHAKSREKYHIPGGRETAAHALKMAPKMHATRLARQKNKGARGVRKAIDVDIDAGHYGVADYAGGQVSMRVGPNPKCNGCMHYKQDVSLCSVGLVPAVCGDGANPDIGYAPSTTSPVAAAKWKGLHADAVAMPAQAENHPVIQDIPFRIEVLGDSSLALSERMTLVKSAYDVVKGSLSKEKARKILHDKKVHGHPLTDKQRKYMGAVASGSAKKSEVYALTKSLVEDLTGEQLFDGEAADISKGASLDDFADAMGTTVDVVSDIARRLGSKEDFAQFIKSKLPDIMMAHGLDETAVNQLYRAAMKVVKSLSDSQWSAWKGFNLSGASDEEIADAINRNGGLLDRNALLRGTVLPAEKQSTMPAPEPIQSPEQTPIVPLVGGNLALADHLGRY